jgi:adenylate cyclase
MSLAVLNWLYRKLGRFYPGIYLTLELQSAYLIAAGTVALFSVYYDAGKEDFLIMLAIVAALCAVAITATLIRTYPRLRPISRWIEGQRDEESTVRAWSAAVALPLDLIRHDFAIPVLTVVIPSCLAAVVVLDLSWLVFFPLFFGAMVAMAYTGILHYLVTEAGMRPVLVDITQGVAPRLESVAALPLRLRLMATLPLINLITGLVVVALTSDGETQSISLDVFVAIAIATAISLELTILLSKSILRPIRDLQRATDMVRKGRYDTGVPITTGDELGDLAVSFNQMVEGLREREKIRDAFGTYLDKEVAEYILSEEFPEEGVELEVSVLFCDVQDFTRFAARANAQEVVSRLNELFELVVPIISRHGGHVDKFVGDGTLAVFGAPEPYPDHAERAVRAAVEMVREANDSDRDVLRIGVGVNTGRVVAGSIGGAGRLDFSVIGDPVNVAARVESATRQTESDILITEATARKLGDDFELTECGPMELKGIDEPMSTFAPKLRERAPISQAGHAGDVRPESAERLGAPPDAAGDGAKRGLGSRPNRTHTLPGS